MPDFEQDLEKIIGGINNYYDRCHSDIYEPIDFETGMKQLRSLIAQTVMGCIPSKADEYTDYQRGYNLAIDTFTTNLKEKGVIQKGAK